jgi:hypothetical protein
MTTTFYDMDPIVVQAASILAQRTHGSIGAVVSELARKGLEICAPDTLEQLAMPEVMPASQRNGFPVFSLAAGASPISTEEVMKILSDEELPG